jgi:hypothetical protein
VLGVTLRAAADRYLPPGMDFRKVQAELRWLRTELLAAARRAHAYGDARALQLDIAAVLPTGSARKGALNPPHPWKTSGSGSIRTEFYSEAGTAS